MSVPSLPSSALSSIASSSSSSGFQLSPTSNEECFLGVRIKELEQALGSWIQSITDDKIDPEEFWESLKSGVILCK
jgi:hypothetical protein